MYSYLGDTSLEAERGRSLGRDAWLRLRKNRLALAGGIVVALTMALCFLAPVLAPYSYEEQNLALGAVGPRAAHWLGTDTLGRDLFTRLLYGGRISMMVGLCGTAVSLRIGGPYGAIAGFVGGKLDVVMMRLVDIIYALPFTIFVILLMVLWKDAGGTAQTFFRQHFGWQVKIANIWSLLLLFAAIGAVEWLTMARIVRGQVQSLKHQE